MPTLLYGVVHRGEILEAAVRQSDSGVKELADKLGVSRQTIYDYFKNPELPLDIILRVGKFIHHNFIPQVPELREAMGEMVVEESQSQYRSKLEDCQDKLFKYMELYSGAMQKVNELLEENHKLRDG